MNDMTAHSSRVRDGRCGWILHWFSFRPTSPTTPFRRTGSGQGEADHRFTMFSFFYLKVSFAFLYFFFCLNSPCTRKREFKQEPEVRQTRRDPVVRKKKHPRRPKQMVAKVPAFSSCKQNPNTQHFVTEIPKAMEMRHYQSTIQYARAFGGQ